MRDGMPRRVFLRTVPAAAYALTTATNGAADVSRSYAGVELKNSVLTASTSETTISFEGMNVQSLTNLLTNERYISNPGPGWLDLNLKNPAGTALTPGTWRLEVDPETGTLVGRITASDATRLIRLTVGVDDASQEIFFRLEGRSDNLGVRSVFWGIQGFNPLESKFIFPGQAGIYFDAETNPAQLGLEYPTHWEAQFAIYQRSDGGVLLYARDPKPYFKRVIATREMGTLDIGFEVFAMAPWAAANDVPVVEWRLKSYRGDWRVAADHYRNWQSGIWPKPQPDGRQDWARTIRAVVRITNPEIAQLEELAKHVDPAKTLVYLVNWRADAYDVNYPDYTPGARTPLFVERTHELGFRIMLHANALGVATYHPAYSSVSQYQLRNPDTEELIYWPWGLWPAGPPPPEYVQSFAFISPAAAAYRALFTESIRPALEALHPDALHLDAGGVLLNDGNGLVEGMTSMEGMIRLNQELLAIYPQLVLSYESMTETLTPFYGLAQRWPADFPSHPVGTYLMGDEVTFYGFLDQPNPDEPGFINYIKRYEAQGVMPSLQINSLDDLKENLPVTSSILRMIRLWQEYDFRPDWDGNWQGLHFRFISPDGQHRARLEDLGKIVRLSVDDELIYERVRETNTFDTTACVRGWTAFDGTTIYGLNPERQYWLHPDLQGDADKIRLARVPVGARLGEGSFATGDYAYYELEGIAPGDYDFARGFHEAKTGMIYYARDYPLGYGGSAQVTRTLIAGALKSPVLFMHPPWRVPGSAVFVEYPLEIPSADSPSLLTFSAGISDFGLKSDGALFVIRIDGTEVWRKEIGRLQLVPGEVVLSPWAGRTVRLRFIVHPGMRLNPATDFACWADLKISSRPRITPVRFDVLFPAEVAEASLSGTACWAGPFDGSVAAVQSNLPARFVVFAKSPPQPALGDSLLDFPRDVWKVGNEGWPILFRVETSGEIVPVASGGERESRALSTIPPSKGRSVVTFGVRLPQEASLLRFRVGLADPSPPLPPTINYSGAGVSIKINGETVLQQTLNTNVWSSHALDISQWQGQNVIFQLEADSQNNAIFDWVHWAGLTIE